VPQLAPRTVVVERELLQSFAQPTADGTCVELVAGDSAHPRPASLQDLASQLGINRSSAHRHVAALEQAGRLQRRGRRLYAVSPDATKESTLQPEPQDPRPSPSTKEVLATPDCVLQLLDKVTDLLILVADMANQLLDAPHTAGGGAQDPRLGGAHTAAGIQLRAADVAVRPRGFPIEVDLIDGTDPEITSNPSTKRATVSRNLSGRRATESRSPDPRDWTTGDLPNLLAPLLEECVRLELPGVADAERVAKSLDRYKAEQIAAAARQMAADLRSGAPMRSPIAILVRKAEDGDPYYFRAQRAPAASPGPPLVIVEQPEEAVDIEAVAAVDELHPEALRQLDEAVATHVRSILGARTSALESPDTLAYWRPIVWRSQHEPPRAEGM